MRHGAIILAVIATIASLAAAGSAGAASPRHCRSLQEGQISRIRVTHYTCSYADGLLHRFVTLRRGRWHWTAPAGKRGFYEGFWKVRSSKGHPHAWTCTAKIPFLQVMGEVAGPGTAVCALRHPSGRITARLIG